MAVEVPSPGSSPNRTRLSVLGQSATSGRMSNDSSALRCARVGCLSVESGADDAVKVALIASQRVRRVSSITGLIGALMDLVD